MRWGTEKQLEFIDLRLFWDGVVNRQELVGTFGISLQQASADYARYLEIALATLPTIAPRTVMSTATPSIRGLTTPDSARQLAHLWLMAEGIVDEGYTRLGEMPPFDIVPGPARRIDPMVLRTVLDAIRRRQAIECDSCPAFRCE